MYNAKRDGYGKGANLAIQSMGEIEGRMTVLEVVAMTSLSLLIKDGDKHAAQQALSAIRRAMRLKCEDIKLSSLDADSAIAYAQELFEATFENMGREATKKAAPSSKRRGSRRSIPAFQS
ncbi:hypothetical protein ASE04_25710 [Rhizobium sp. Root708]|uniref:hypothetical protein n=1 Tax=Rhizobium sp. Root708 TaxID=1736592 RepID=UPI0006F30975|nr:hypothetical protein [Rhizobium sp. Root708]KRB59523.1 hypothetical protein ASE04_25710 [Rhizobium sp. Root708]